MKKILIFFALFIPAVSNSQTIKEAKDFLKQNIETNPISNSYVLYPSFGDDGKVNNPNIIGNFLPSELESVFIITERLTSPTLGDIRFISYAFSVRNIKNILVTSKQDNIPYTELKIYFKENSTCKYFKKASTGLSESKFVETAYIYISQNQNLGERIAKSLYFLCKQFGGSPNEKPVF